MERSGAAEVLGSFTQKNLEGGVDNENAPVRAASLLNSDGVQRVYFADRVAL